MADSPESPAVQRRGRRVGRGLSAVLVGYAFVVVMLSATLPTPLYPIYQQRYGYSGLVTTTIFAAYAVGVIAALLLLGRLSDQIGRRPVLLCGLAFAALSDVVFLLPGGLTPLLLARVLSGVSAGIFTATATAALLDLVPQSQQHRAGLVAAAVNMLGLGLGPLVAGLLAELLPAPLHTPYLASLVLVVLAGAGLALSVEPRPGSGGFALRPQRLRVTGPARAVFPDVALAGFAGFCVIGLFAAVSPLFLGAVLGVHDHALVGAVVFSFFAASAVGQVVTAGVAEHRAQLYGAGGLAVGSVLVGGSLLVVSLPLLLLGAVLAGVGQGASFRAGLTSLGRTSDTHQRAEVCSSYFVVCYVAITIPVVGVGALAYLTNFVIAGTVFSAVVAILALIAVALLRRRASRA